MANPTLKGTHLLLGVCGSIAAYKSAYLTRLLVKEDMDVQVVMTPAATEFVTPLTFSTLSRHPVLIDFMEGDTGTWNNHVELAQWSDYFLVAPLTAQTLAAFANGYCSNLLSAAYLSYTGPAFLAPAMDRDMFEHETTATNRYTLHRRGEHIITGEEGELASGLEGKGRMAEPEQIVEYLKKHVPPPSEKTPPEELTASERALLEGKHVMVTAGPTYEPIDEVRFIGNRSSGKMGFAIAEVLAGYGAEVTLVTGPTALSAYHPAITRVDVNTAQEMYDACHEHFGDMDVTIGAAAVADFKVDRATKGKIKKREGVPQLQFTATPDILASLGKKKQSDQVVGGFALEEEHTVEKAQKKRDEKHLDFIVLNALSEEQGGFAADQNKVSFINRNDEVEHFSLKTKGAVAQDITKKIVELLNPS